jgi:hypothetical protein
MESRGSDLMCLPTAMLVRKNLEKKADTIKKIGSWGINIQ